ncbi:uncharacterized protein N7511_008527 [Penicillium nucicola]|uniref:uncharacterized protein n=1 Tax=Penicillium nucicola TaxID=1850975 RepID=UPI0025452E34|nr:uncharacterized protein N7511_008527 [Penicillium nucicola]KAJ5746831.1 hypothetical protein N7511_008527 [Penicillium nucicola]
MQQHDLPALLHTNAEVLTYFLHARNRQYIQAIDLAGKRLSEVGLLRRLKDNKIRVLLDAGAFILEMDNQTLVHHRKAYLKYLQQLEQRTLEQLYGPRILRGDEIASQLEGNLQLFGKLRRFVDILEDKYHPSTSDRESVLPSALEEVEQQREVANEVEQERELQRPSFIHALEFPGLHQVIQDFVETGFLSGDDVCPQACTVITSTRLWKKQMIETFSLISHVFLSPEFARTVRLGTEHESDNFIRPVNWVLLSMRSDVALVIIPEEAELVIPILREQADPPTHLLLYAAPFTKRMLHFNRLDYYSLPRLPIKWSPPSWLPFELGILAGRFYLAFAECQDFQHRIHASSGRTSESDRLPKSTSIEVESILSFLQEWLNLRRPGQDISHTPMGYICQGLTLRSDHHFFASPAEAEISAIVNGDMVYAPCLLYDDEESDSVSDGEVTIVDQIVEEKNESD